jgi:hypothetical protein
MQTMAAKSHEKSDLCGTIGTIIDSSGKHVKIICASHPAFSPESSRRLCYKADAFAAQVDAEI